MVFWRLFIIVFDIYYPGKFGSVLDQQVYFVIINN